MRRLAVIALLLPGLASSAHADALDGDWCSAEGKNLRIEGPRIRTPAGMETTGIYRRHSFTYEPPAGDPERGLLILIEQVHEELMRLVRVKDGQPGAAEEWRRCNVTS